MQLTDATTMTSPSGEERRRGRVAEPVDLVVDRAVLLDVGVARRQVRLGLVVVVVADEVLHPVVGKELPHLVGQLGGQGLVGGDDERRPLHRLDRPRHRGALAATRDAEQGLEPVAPSHALGQLDDGGRLVPGRRKIRPPVNSGMGPMVQGPSDDQAWAPRARIQAHTRSISVSRAAGPSLLSTTMSATWRRSLPVDLGRHPRPGIVLAETPVLHQAGDGHLLGRVHHHDGVQLKPFRGDDAEQRHVEHHDRVRAPRRRRVRP